MRAKLEPTELETQLGTLIRGALGNVIGEAMKAAVAAELPRALAAMRMPARPAEEPPYVRRKRAAEIMGYSRSTVGRLIARGLLRASGPKRDRIKRTDIDRFMSAAGERQKQAIDDDDALEAEARRIVDEE